MTNRDIRVAIVILNYKTPKETMALIDSIEEQSWHDRVKIYIVDNGSKDDSVDRIKEAGGRTECELIESEENLGFARGNNLGIKKALDDGYGFVLVSNSDIVLERDPSFLEKLEKIYNRDKDIAVIAPAIKNMDGVYQNPFREESFSLKEIIKMKLFYLSGFYRIYYFLRVYVLYDIMTYIVRIKSRNRATSTQCIKEAENGYIYAPHGSFLIFTPTFFKHYDGFDDKTFLYCEEFILAEMLRQNNLKCWYENTLSVLHKESRSTSKVAKNYKEKVKFSLKYTFSSCKYFSRIIKIGNL